MNSIIKTTLIVLLAVTGIQLLAQETKTVVYECSFDCQSCEAKVLKNIPYEKGVKDVYVNYEDKIATVTYKSGKNTDKALKEAIEKLGFKAEIKGEALSFGVNGNCEMCKNKIETAALGVKGVTFAYWNQDKKQVLVVFNEPANLEQIHNAIATVGYDTDMVKADDEVYNNLHHCCKYDRN